MFHFILNGFRDIVYRKVQLFGATLYICGSAVTSPSDIRKANLWLAYFMHFRPNRNSFCRVMTSALHSPYDDRDLIESDVVTKSKCRVIEKHNKEFVRITVGPVLF